MNKKLWEINWLASPPPERFPSRKLITGNKLMFSESQFKFMEMEKIDGLLWSLLWDEIELIVIRNSCPKWRANLTLELLMPEVSRNIIDVKLLHLRDKARKSFNGAQLLQQLKCSPHFIILSLPLRRNAKLIICYSLTSVALCFLGYMFRTRTIETTHQLKLVEGRFQ